jgi:hypothetical protein
LALRGVQLRAVLSAGLVDDPFAALGGAAGFVSHWNFEQVHGAGQRRGLLPKVVEPRPACMNAEQFRGESDPPDWLKSNSVALQIGKDLLDRGLLEGRPDQHPLSFDLNHIITGRAGTVPSMSSAHLRNSEFDGPLADQSQRLQVWVEASTQHTACLRPMLPRRDLSAGTRSPAPYSLTAIPHRNSASDGSVVNQPNAGTRPCGYPKKEHMQFHKKPEVMSRSDIGRSSAAAIEAGADSCYFGLKHFSAGAKVGFELSELPEAMRTLHRRGVRGCLTFNTLVFEHELAEAARAIGSIAEAGVDALIVQVEGLVHDIPAFQDQQIEDEKMDGR